MSSARPWGSWHRLKQLELLMCREHNVGILWNHVRRAREVTLLTLASAAGEPGNVPFEGLRTELETFRHGQVGDEFVA